MAQSTLTGKLTGFIVCLMGHIMCGLFLHIFIVWVIFFALPYSLTKLAFTVNSRHY